MKLKLVFARRAIATMVVALVTLIAVPLVRVHASVHHSADCVVCAVAPSMLGEPVSGTTLVVPAAVGLVSTATPRRRAWRPAPRPLGRGPPRVVGNFTTDHEI